ncbi:uncharacterized protein LOC142239634 [Haematobia irritans]|uniref:uncharacterized protein LOC142239634 n=1 Tax=Haematobia irritans TaxID=7368 RepID=UPI003F4F9504
MRFRLHVLKFRPKTLLSLFCVLTLPVIITALESYDSHGVEVNLTDWREHRRKKRFILFENSGVVKFVAGITYPVDLQDKRPWRQLVTTYNLQYQYGLPSQPLYWWDKWDRRNLPPNDGSNLGPIAEPPTMHTDEAQEFLYAFAESLMDRKNMNGRQCLQKAICENAQIHVHQGLYAELLHRFLRPHHNLDAKYVDAWEMGKNGVNCQETFNKATNCLLDQYTHVREEFMDHTTVK